MLFSPKFVLLRKVDKGWMNFKNTTQDIKKNSQPHWEGLFKAVWRVFASYVDASPCSCKNLVNSLHKLRPWKRFVIQKVQTRWLPPPGSVEFWGKALPDLSRRACPDEPSSGALGKLWTSQNIVGHGLSTCMVSWERRWVGQDWEGIRK